MWDQYLTDRVGISRYAAPAREENLAALPSAYISSAEFDPLRDEATLWALRLRQAGVAVELHQVADAAISRRALSDQIHHLERFLRT